MRRPVLALTVVALLVAGCSSSGDAPATSSAASTETSTGTSGNAAGAALAKKIAAGIDGLSSAHLDVDAGALGGKIGGDVTFDNGTTTGSDLMIDQGTGAIEVITVDGTSYAKLPTAHNTSGKPWVVVSADSSNEFVRALAGSLTLTRAATSLDGVTDLLSTAVTSVRDAGSAKVNAVAAHHYQVKVDPAKTTGDLKSALSLAGSAPLDADLWLDAKNRPVRVRIAIPLGQSSLPLTVDIGDFDAPVTIEAPPSDQIAS